MNNPLSLGTIRTIDDLGRIVLPREIRNKLGIHPKDSMEIRTSGQTILLKKYEEMQTLLSLCNEYLEAFAKSSSTACAICSTQFVLAARGIALSDNYPLSGPVRKLINELQVYHYQDTEKSRYSIIAPTIWTVSIQSGLYQNHWAVLFYFTLDLRQRKKGPAPNISQIYSQI